MSEEGFLSRWSRRKRQARRREPNREPAGSASLESDAGNPPPAVEPEISAEELARLPPIEELTAETNLAQFLRKGVPLALRNAALRRVWALDPKIRDHIGEARDYAYDWNVPGGVPGSGQIPEPEIEGLLRRVIGEAEPGSGQGPPQPAAGMTSSTDQNTEAEPVRRLSPGTPDRSADPELPPEPAPTGRRHGGAVPV